MEKTILEIRNLTKYYGNIRGVEDVSLELKEGEVFGFIGPNGAGKSTTIRSIMHLLNRTSGWILFQGKEFHRNDTEIKEMIGYLPSEVYLYDDLTVKEMLDYHETFYKKDIHARRQELVELLKLDESKNIEDLSLGNLKKLGIILALMHGPKLVILDEPTSGLDPIMQNVFYEILLKEKEKGTTIFYSTHVLSEVSKICDRVGIIKDGHLIKIENIEELSNKKLTYVTVTSKECEQIIQELGCKIISQSDNTVKFANSMPSGELLQVLVKYPIDKLLIEEPMLEDLFMHYYSEER